MTNNKQWHKSVLLKEAIKLLKVVPGGRYVDATLGTGGYSQEILKKGGRLLSIDLDPEMIKLTKQRFKNLSGDSWEIVQDNFINIGKICKEKNHLPLQGVIFDLGISSLHYKDLKRGFSFKGEGKLDMRLDPKQKITAAAILEQISKEELENILLRLVQEKLAKKIASAIIRGRQKNRLKNPRDLAQIVRQVYEKEGIRTKRDPATKLFLALRILVNKELENIKKGLRESLKILAPQGRLVVVSFHSGEDRIVKKFFQSKKQKNKLVVLTKRPIYPSFKEKASNPLSRSARLRAGEKK